MNEWRKVVTAFELDGDIYEITQFEDSFSWNQITKYTWDKYFGRHAEPTIENVATFVFDVDNETERDDGMGCGGYDTYEETMEDIENYINGTFEF